MSLIDEARVKINEIDKKMVELFEERMKAVLDVLEYKKQHNLPVFDEKREKELLERVSELAGEELNDYCRELYEKIMEISRDYQQDYFNKEVR